MIDSIKKNHWRNIRLYCQAVQAGISRAKLEITENTMGQNTSRTEYCTTPENEEKLNNGRWRDLPTRVIDFSHNTYSNPFRHCYRIKWDTRLHNEQNIILLFPNYRRENYRYIRVCDYWSITRLQKDINERLRESNRVDTINMYVASGNDFYAIDNIMGNVYLIWAEHVNTQSVNDCVAQRKDYVPFLVETNGEHERRSIFRIGTKECIDEKDCDFIDPIDTTLFCLELDPRRAKHVSIKTISNSEAEKITTDPISRDMVSMMHEDPPFPSDSDTEDLQFISESGTKYNTNKESDEYV